MKACIAFCIAFCTGCIEQNKYRSACKKFFCFNSNQLLTHKAGSLQLTSLLLDLGIHVCPQHFPNGVHSKLWKKRYNNLKYRSKNIIDRWRETLICLLTYLRQVQVRNGTVNDVHRPTAQLALVQLLQSVLNSDARLIFCWKRFDTPAMLDLH